MARQKDLDKPKIGWMYPQFPANLATGPLSTLIPLYILEIGGGIVAVALAITITSIIAIPAVFLWGYITDVLNVRKKLIILSFLLTSLLLLILFFVHTVNGIILVYAAITFITAASAAPTNLLVMETADQKHWAHNFSALQAIMSAGVVAGLLMSFIVTGVASLGLVIIGLMISSFVSTVLALRLIKEPTLASKRVSLSDTLHSFVYRVANIPGALVRIPSPKNMRHMFSFKGVVGQQRRFITRFYIISLIFFLASSLFNTEYPVGLKLGGLSESFIFLVVLTSMIVQTIIFYYHDYFTKGLDRKNVIVSSILVRAACYAILGIVFIGGSALLFGISNLFLYAIGAGAMYAIYYPALYYIFFTTMHGRENGSALGIYSGVAGIGTFSGAIIAGAFVVQYGFGFTIIASAGITLLCGLMFGFLIKK